MKTSPEETLQQYSINHLGHGDEWWISSFLLTVLHMLDSHPPKETVLEKLVVKPPTGAKTKFDTEVLYCVCHHSRSVSRPFNDPLQPPTISRLEIFWYLFEDILSLLFTNLYMCTPFHFGHHSTSPGRPLSSPLTPRIPDVHLSRHVRLIQFQAHTVGYESGILSHGIST